MSTENKVHGYITDSGRLQFVVDKYTLYVNASKRGEIVLEVYGNEWICDIYIVSETTSVINCNPKYTFPLDSEKQLPNLISIMNYIQEQDDTTTT